MIVCRCDAVTQATAHELVAVHVVNKRWLTKPGHGLLRRRRWFTKPGHGKVRHLRHQIVIPVD
jgi:hypothetical protein